MKRSRKGRNVVARTQPGKPREKVQHITSNILVTMGGGLLASLIANMLPIKDVKKKPLIPLALGAGAIGYGLKKKSSVSTSLGAGMVTLGLIATIRQYFPKVPLLAGEDESTLLGADDYIQPQIEYSGDEYEMGDPVSLAVDDMGDPISLAFDDEISADEIDFAADDDMDGEDELSGSGAYASPATI